MWLPRFLSEDRMRDVRRLVILDWLLSGTGERWTTHADHLSEVDRAQARAILESQRTGLREALRRAVQECYGAAAPVPGHPGRGRRARPGAGQPGRRLLARRAGRRGPGRGVRQPGRPGVHRDLPGASAVRAGRRRGHRAGPGRRVRARGTGRRRPGAAGQAGGRHRRRPPGRQRAAGRHGRGDALPVRRRPVPRGARSSSGPPPGTAPSPRIRSPWARSGAGSTRCGPSSACATRWPT